MKTIEEVKEFLKDKKQIPSEEFLEWFENKNIIVPKNIKIIKYQNEQLGIVFPNDKQVLTFDKTNNIYIVQPLDKLNTPIKCELIETTWKDINIGECICMYVYEYNKHEILKKIQNYGIKYTKNKLLTLNPVDDTSSEIFIDDDYNHEDIFRVYKIVPIK